MERVGKTLHGAQDRLHTPGRGRGCLNMTIAEPGVMAVVNGVMRPRGHNHPLLACLPL